VLVRTTTARLDPKTEKLEIFAPPKGLASAGGQIESMAERTGGS
jgi:hypothetical protein